MREIKFRLFSLREKKFVSTKYLQISKEGKLIVPNGCRASEFTGLKDKNGKEIYEGDIVKVKKSHKEIRDVVFEDFAWVTRKIYKGKDGHTSLYCLSKHETYEVIGNIYENPELLKK